MLFVFECCRPDSRDSRPSPHEHLTSLVFAESALLGSAGGFGGGSCFQGVSIVERPSTHHTTNTTAAMEWLGLFW